MGHVDARPVAVARMGLGVASVMTLVEGYVYLSRISQGSVGMPVAEWVPGPHPLPLLVVLVVGVTAGFALTLGFRSSVAAALCAVVEVVVLLWDQQTYSNHRVLVLLMCAYLAFASPGSAWSVGTARGRQAPTVRYWPQFLMMTQLSVCYLFAGLSKINPVFLGGHVFESQIWWSLPEVIYPPLAALTVLVEIFLAFALWFARTRVLGAMLGICLHLSIVVMLRDPVPLLAFTLMCVPLYPLYFQRAATTQTPVEVPSVREGALEQASR